MAEAFKPLTADMSHLIRQFAHKVVPLNFEGDYADYKYMSAQLEVYTPQKIRGDYLEIVKIREVRFEILNLLKNWAVRVKREMLAPVQHWEVKPEIKAGLPLASKGVIGNAPVTRFSQKTDYIATGAFVSANLDHTPWGGKRIRPTQDDANWHYIWANNGTAPRVVEPVFKKWIRYNTHYTPGTAPGTLGSGLGTYDGRWRRARGTVSSVRPRDFVGQIIEAVQPEFERDAVSAVIDGLRKYKARSNKLSRSTG